MNKNKSLSPFLLHEIFGQEELVLLSKDKKIQKPDHLGNNQKQVLILVEEKKHEFLSSQDLSFLQNILKAIQYEVNDVAIINLENKQYNIEELIEYFEPKQIISFKVPPFNLGIQNKNIPKYTFAEIRDNIPFLHADALAIIQNDTDKKKALWLGIQRMFKLV